MAIKIRNKRSAEFSTASMSDLVFLLLIFFMLTSTLVSPNAIKLLLPSSSSDRTMADRRVLTIYIDDQSQFYVEENLVNEIELSEAIFSELSTEAEATVVLRADASVPVQLVVHVIDVVNEVNRTYDTKHKVILATKPK